MLAVNVDAWALFDLKELESRDVLHLNFYSTNLQTEANASTLAEDIIQLKTEKEMN